MLLVVPKVLSTEEVAHVRSVLATAKWVDGRETGPRATIQAKNNLQLATTDPVRVDLARTVVSALERAHAFQAAALPLKILSPGFNRYNVGQGYGDHVDRFFGKFDGQYVRSDLSATLFLSAPEEYDGGELTVHASGTTYRVKLPAGDLLVYASTSVHSVQPITRGERFASFFWVQSMVRDAQQRTLLHELDQSIQRVLAGMPDDPVGKQLLAVHHNLLRRWAEM